MNFEQLPSLPFDVPENVLSKAAQIKLALFDVDGVLTDGSLHYGPQGEEIKVFNALDGHGLKMLQMANIAVGIITARDSGALRRRLNDLGIEHVYTGVNDKLAVYEQLVAELDVNADQCCYTGDD
ncbi:MAG: phenylphosphate carboxylase subunit delta, partial [Pseudomonadota bacterium]